MDWFNGLPKEHRVAYYGQHAAGIYICPNCDADLLGKTDEHTVGFAEVSGKPAQVVLCPACGERFYFHAYESLYTGWLATLERLDAQHAAAPGGEER